MINLIPHEVRKRRGVKSLLYVLIVSYVFAVAIVVLGAIGLATYTFIAKANIGESEALLANLQAEKNQNKDLAARAAFIESRLSQKDRYTSTVDWSALLQKVAESVPTNVTLTGLKAAEDEAKSLISLTLSGSTTDRRAVVLFKDKLATNPTFTAAAISNLSETDGDTGKTFNFDISLTLSN